MSDTAEQVVETQVEAAETKQDNKEGYKQVDFKSSTPEEIEARFNRLYGQTKHLQRDLGSYRDLAKQQADVIADLQKGVYAIADHVNDQRISETEAKLEDELSAALEVADYKKAAKIQSKLSEVQTRKIISEQKKAEKPRDNTPPQQQYISASQMADQAVQDGDLTQEQAHVAKAWGAETDDSGNVVRPWVVNRGTEERPDPDYVKALLVTEEIFNDPRYASLSFEARLNEVDKKMGTRKGAAKQSVMGGGLTGKPRNVKVTLSSDAEKLATRMKYAGPGKSDAEHIEAYRKQIDRVKSTGARK